MEKVGKLIPVTLSLRRMARCMVEAAQMMVTLSLLLYMPLVLVKLRVSLTQDV